MPICCVIILEVLTYNSLLHMIGWKVETNTITSFKIKRPNKFIQFHYRYFKLLELVCQLTNSKSIIDKT